MKYLIKMYQFLRETFTPVPNIIPQGYKDCEECNGQGVFMIEKCPECSGKGIVKMSYQDYVDSL